MTKRECFAALAMQGAMAGLGVAAAKMEDVEPVNAAALAIDMVKAADALLDELDQPRKLP